MAVRLSALRAIRPVLPRRFLFASDFGTRICYSKPQGLDFGTRIC
jgi:hypothetical protein